MKHFTSDSEIKHALKLTSNPFWRKLQMTKWICERVIKLRNHWSIEPVGRYGVFVGEKGDMDRTESDV